MSNEKTLYGAMDAFRSLSGAVVFSANEIALFYALIDTWNMAHRPEVIQQWANTTSAKSGLGEKNQLPNTRNSLVQKGVIYFAKDGTRGVPHYSLNALFNESEPPLLLEISSKGGSKPRSKGRTKTRVKAGVKPDSYEDKEKDKGKDIPSNNDGELNLSLTASEQSNCTLEDSIERIYAAYPRKVGKGAALKAIRTALKKTDETTIMEALKGFCGQIRTQQTEKRFIPHPATWFNRESWLDQPEIDLPDTENGNEPRAYGRGGGPADIGDLLNN